MNPRLLCRRCCAGALAAAVLLVAAGAGHALYIRPMLEKVPVEKLVANLQKLVDEKPKDAQLRLNLARVHAMAYALKTDTAEVNAKAKVPGAWFGYEPTHVPFKSKPTDDPAKQKAAQEHLKKAIQRYKETVDLDPDNLTARLGLAWVIDQSKDRKEAIKQYRDVIERAWAKEMGKKTAGLGWHSVTAEAAGYLTPLLDTEKDAKEIAELKDRVAQMRRVIRPITPLAVPLRDGLKAQDLLDPSARVAFDLDGSGHAQKWTWITPDAGWLVYDRGGKGEVTSGLQLFGNVTFWLFWENGYQALAALDDDGDGTLRGRELEHLAIWQDRNGNGVAEQGEVKTLAQWGIVALSCRCERDTSHPEGILYSAAGVRFRDGSTRPTYDLILHRR
jgi:tetratricopeptide (TPR) repeat protein